MNTVQIISALAAAAFIAQPFAVEYFKKLSQNKLKQAEPELDMLKGPALPEISHVVSQWAALKSACDELNLKEASNALDSIFPLFVKKG